MVSLHARATPRRAGVEQVSRLSIESRASLPVPRAPRRCWYAACMEMSAAELRIHEKSASPHPLREQDLVQLDPDHPGFRDPAYRERRNQIARIAFQHQDGPIPQVRYTPDEQATWRTVWEHLEPLHRKYASGEYL